MSGGCFIFTDLQEGTNLGQEFVGKFFTAIGENLVRDAETANPLGEYGGGYGGSFFIMYYTQFGIPRKCVCDAQDVRFTGFSFERPEEIAVNALVGLRT